MNRSAREARIFDLLDAFPRLLRAGSVEEVIAIVHSDARRAIGCDGICLVLREEGLCHYAGEDAISPLWQGQRFPSDACVSGWVMRERRSIVIPDVFEDDRVPHALYSQTFVRSMAIAPVGEPPEAALGAYWSERDGPDDFSAHLLDHMAAAVGAAFDRLRLIGQLGEPAR